MHVKGILVDLDKKKRIYTDTPTLNLGSPMRHAHSTTSAPARSGNAKKIQHACKDSLEFSHEVCNREHGK